MTFTSLLIPQKVVKMADNEEDSLFGEVASGDSKTEDKDDLFADTTEVPLDDDKPKDSSSEQKKAEDEKPKGEAASIPVASQNGEESKRKKNEVGKLLYLRTTESTWIRLMWLTVNFTTNCYSESELVQSKLPFKLITCSDLSVD